MTIKQLQQEFLISSGKKLTPEDFFILLSHATQKEKVFLLAHPEHNLDKKDVTLAKEYFKRRLEHEPVALITGHKEFYGYDFKVTTDTLIPRPETELLVELALNEVRNYESKIMNQENVVCIDIGTGSGNIIISIASELRKSHSPFILLATDISKKALSIAKKNAKIHSVDRTITFLHGDLLVPCHPYIKQNQKIIITANLPYLSQTLYKETSPEVHDFEPISALVSEREGLDHYYRLLESIKNLPVKKPPLILFLEISPEQTIALKSFVSSLFPNAKILVHKDLAEKDRVVQIDVE